MAYPILDRTAVRRDVSVIDRWAERVELLYKEELASFVLRFDPRDDRGREDALRDWEQAATRDREWAEGYRRGLDDALANPAERRGPGVMAHDPKDGWSASQERTAGYDEGLSDGGERRTP